MISSTVNVLVIYSVYQISSEIQAFPNLGYEQFKRNPPNTNLREERNVQLLDPENIDVSVNEDDLGTPYNNEQHASLTHNSHLKESKSDLKVAPDNVIRVQEITGLLWPMGVVPYFIESYYDNATVKRIDKAMSTIESVSCVVFKELESKPTASVDAWLHFTNPRNERECQHSFAEVHGASEVVLGYDCLRPEEILHSLLHALGFRDEVSHPHRDQYIRVLWENIQPKYRDLYRIRYEDGPYKLVEYDPMSIMHFHDRAFSDNGGPTIAARIPGLQITYTTTLSQLDIMRLKLAFSHECNKRNVKDLLDTCKNTLSNKSGMKSVETVDERDYQTNTDNLENPTSNENYQTGEENVEGADVSTLNDPTDIDDQAGLYQEDDAHRSIESEETDNVGNSIGVRVNNRETLTGTVNQDREAKKFRSYRDYHAICNMHEELTTEKFSTGTGLLEDPL